MKKMSKSKGQGKGPHKSKGMCKNANKIPGRAIKYKCGGKTK